jgi:hypothetical protein
MYPQYSRAFSRTSLTFIFGEKGWESNPIEGGNWHVKKHTRDIETHHT